MNFEQLYAKRAGCMKTSEIREFFQLTEQPDVISFAGGFPSAEYFPLERINAVLLDVIAKEGKTALQRAPDNTTSCHAVCFT